MRILFWLWIILIPHLTLILLVESEKSIQAFEYKCLRKNLHVCYWQHKTNYYVRWKVKSPMCHQESLIATIKRRNGLATSHCISASARLSCKALLKADASGDGNTTAGQTTKRGWTSQCWNSWESLPIDHTGRGCLFLWPFSRRLKPSRDLMMNSSSQKFRLKLSNPDGGDWKILIINWHRCQAIQM